MKLTYISFHICLQTVERTDTADFPTRLNTGWRHQKALVCVQFPDRITEAFSWSVYTEPITTHWAGKPHHAVPHHHCSWIWVLWQLQAKPQQLTDLSESLTFWEECCFLLNLDLKVWTGFCKGNIDHINWDAADREKGGSSSHVIVPFKLIVKSHNENTRSSHSVLHTHR